VGKLLAGKWKTDGRIIAINPGEDDEIQFPFESLPVQIVINDEDELHYFILGADDEGELHMIRDRDGGSLKKSKEVLL